MICCFKNDKNLVTFDLKKYRGVILHATEEKNFGLENDMKNLTNFHQSTSKCQNWDFDGILSSKIQNV